MMKNFKMVVICALLLIVAGGIYTQRMQSVKQETPIISVTPTTLVDLNQEDNVFTVTKKTENETTIEEWYKISPFTGKEEMIRSWTIKRPENHFVEWKNLPDKNAETVVIVDLTSEEKIFP